MSLRRRNEDAFRHRYPAVWDKLAGLDPPATRGDQDDRGQVVNIDLGRGRRLYPRPAPDWSQDQVAGFLADPDRLTIGDPAERPLSRAARALLPELRAFLGDAPLADAPLTDVGYAFVYGIGLGYHLPDLVANCPCRTYVLVEPVPEFLWHSLSAIDWAELMDRVDAQGGRLHFILGAEPERTMLEIEGLLIHGAGRAFLDGSYAYLHYPSWALRQARLLLNQRIANFFVHSSNLEDEALMLDNAFANLVRWPFRLIDGRHEAMAAKDLPLLVVGSGPSLDADLEHVARLHDRALVMSCGSALGILLKNGIRPDLHVENENTDNLVRNLERFAGEHGLQGIRLVAATTVPPDAGALFDEHWFYCRGQLSPEVLLPLPADALPYAGPVVANAATAAATAMGFKDIHLLGVDCGRRPEAGHHARDAVYYEPGYDNFVTDKGDSAEALDSDFSRTAPGNFGGEVETSPYLDLSRRTMTELQRLHGLSFVNCSDGARIDRATPKAAAALDFEPLPAGSREAAVAAVARGLPFYPAGHFAAQLDLRGPIRACEAYAAAWQETLAGAAADCESFWDLEHRLARFRKQRPADQEGVARLVGGSVASMVRLAAYRGTRLPDRSKRQAFLRFVIDRLQTDGAALIDQARALLQDLERRRESGDGGH